MGGGAVRSGRQKLSCIVNLAEHTIQTVQHLHIPEPDHGPSLCFKKSHALRVPGYVRFRTVAIAIQFHDKHQVKAGKVCIIWAYGMLAAKLPTIELAIAKARPDQPFCKRLVTP